MAPAPNHSDLVARIFETHPPPGWDTQPFFTDDDVRREYLLSTMIPELNKVDGRWGALVKNDRTPPFIPSDIIVWQDTREHWDILTNTGPAWQYDGEIQGSWEWMQVLPVGGGLPPDPPPPIVIPPDEMKAMFQVIYDHVVGIETQCSRIEEQTNRILDKLEHYEKQFAEIQPQLILLLTALAKFLASQAGAGGIGDIGTLLGGLLGRRNKE
jgi:hypothetical protein